MDNIEAIREIKNVIRTKEVDCGEEQDALEYAVLMLERVEILRQACEDKCTATGDIKKFSVYGKVVILLETGENYF